MIQEKVRCVLEVLHAFKPLSTQQKSNSLQITSLEIWLKNRRNQYPLCAKRDLIPCIYLPATLYFKL